MDINYEIQSCDYKKYYRDSEYQENKKMFRNIFLKRYNLISRFAKKPKRVLDIGCSNGVFLDLFKNSETWGVEPSESGYKMKDVRHKIVHEYFEKAKLPENYFDLVIMNHTLEHVKDADLILHKIHKILKKNGILFIDVPNSGGLSSKILGDKWPYRAPGEHTYQFTKESLSKIIEVSGFNILHWESRSGLFEFADPLQDLLLSLLSFKKRFFKNLFNLPYSIFVTILNMGDSISFIARK